MIRWSPGLISGPDGEKMREIPQKNVWTSSVFITKRGIARRRHYNTITHTWNWAENNLELVEDEEGRLGYHLEWWISIDRCIALAWVRRHPDSTNKIHVEAGKEPHPKNISWAINEESESTKPLENETWKPLNWRVGAVKCSQDYKISSHGRLMAPNGEVTRGFYFNKKRWAAADAGLVDLHTAARIVPNVIYLAPRIKMAHDCLSSGFSPIDLAEVASIEESTAWSYFSQAVVYLKGSERRRLGSKLVSVDLWAVLTVMKANRQPVLGGTLTALFDYIRESLSTNGEFLNDGLQMEKLRFARVCLM